MSEGFVDNVEFELPKEQVQKLLKSYKKVKKYQKSSLFAIKTIDGTEDIVSKMIEEAEEEGF
jgi:DNA integrity scanning protein DisA with diadenylate cyclase activity